MARSEGQLNRSRLDSDTRSELLHRLRICPTDERSWRELVEFYEPMIFSWCRRWHLQEADALDVTQTVLCKIAERISGFRYDPSRSFRSYLKTLTYFAWVDFLRDRKASRLEFGHPERDFALESLEARDDLVMRLDQAHRDHVLAGALTRVLERVEPTSFEAFRLQALEGCSGAEAAEKLGLTEAAAFKARSRIQAMICQEVLKLDPA